MSHQGSGREKEFWRFITAGDDESDRGFVLSSSAYLELCVERSLIAYLKESESTKRLLRRDGPLGSHAAKTDLCYGLSIIDAHELRALRLYAKIRNEFAHELMADLNAVSTADRSLEFAKCVCLDELEKDVAMKLTERGPRALLTVSSFILADWLRDRDVLVAEMAETVRFDFSHMHRRVQDLLEATEEKLP